MMQQPTKPVSVFSQLAEKGQTGHVQGAATSQSSILQFIPASSMIMPDSGKSAMGQGLFANLAPKGEKAAPVCFKSSYLEDS